MQVLYGIKMMRFKVVKLQICTNRSRVDEYLSGQSDGRLTFSSVLLRVRQVDATLPSGTEQVAVHGIHHVQNVHSFRVVTRWLSNISYICLAFRV